MNKKQKLFLIIFILIGFIFLCKGVANNISTSQKKTAENPITSYLIPSGCEEIDFEKIQGEEYYFYLFADSFLSDLSFFLKEKSADMSKLEKSMSVKADSREKIVQYISEMKEKGYVISKYEFLRTKDSSISFNDFMEVLVLTEFSMDGQAAGTKCLLLSIQKYYDEENITWKLEGIENLEETNKTEQNKEESILESQIVTDF